MVKSLFRYCFSILLMCCLISGCSVDLLGLFGSNDLNKRLKEKDNFHFLSAGDLAPSFGDTYSFVVLADTHIEDGDAFGLEALKDLVEGNTDIKFAVIAGDITQNATKQDIQKFFDIASSLGVPCYPVIGNHDIYFGNWSSWRDMIGSTCYKVEADTATLFILDSATGFFGNEQLNWLEKGLKSSTGRRVFVFTHSNLFVENPLEIQQLTDTAERARVASLLKGRCDAMFTGHLHEQIIKEAGGVKYISIEDYRMQKVYCLVSVTPGGISYEFKKL